MIVRRDAGERAQVGLAALDDLVERLRAMADLEDRHADAGQRHQVALRLLEHLERQHGRPSGKIENSVRSSHGSHGLK